MDEQLKGEQRDQVRREWTLSLSQVPPAQLLAAEQGVEHIMGVLWAEMKRFPPMTSKN